MSREFPDLLNPWKAADGHRSFEGTMPLDRMRRLAPLLAPPVEADDQPGRGVIRKDIWFRADFAHDQQGHVTVELWVEAELPLICQRSLRPYLEPVKRHSLLAVVENAEQEELLPGHYEPVLVEQGRIALLEVVEDELLLAVPEVPRDPAVREVRVSTDDSAAAPSDDGREKTRRPFEGLAGLLKEQKDN